MHEIDHYSHKGNIDMVIRNKMGKTTIKGIGSAGTNKLKSSKKDSIAEIKQTAYQAYELLSECK